MNTIRIYDPEAKWLEELCEKHNTTEAELIEAIFNALEDNSINLMDYL